uniref:Uncharacterized protein n=1 Tax=uncultured prokaryote TaxID=198431 RepID=A0A0H5Q602_9ZZZZ|nr:hypothetical protein [uncultured prokaryote]
MEEQECLLRRLNVCDGESIPTLRWAVTERCYCARMKTADDQGDGAAVRELRWHRARAVARASELERRADTGRRLFGRQGDVEPF